jgi:prostaglandin-E synthase 1
MEALSTTNPAFVAYVLAAVALALNLLGLWAYSGAARGKAKSTPNPEDVAGKVKLAPQEPPEVARVLRAHRNAEASILPFLVLALLYVILGAPATMARVVFGLFVLFRYAHTFAYLGEKQPWRSIAFGLAGLMVLVLMEEDVRRALAG